jgi:flagellar basal-body rod protein FlgC
MHDVLGIMQTAGSALRMQRMRLDTVAHNIANANTTRADGDEPYQRRQIVVRPVEGGMPYQVGGAAGSFVRRFTTALGGVQVTQMVADAEPGPRVHEPGHPDADEEGYVQYPNVDVVVEMTNALSATRSYQANVTIIDMAKEMALKALEIGRR